MKNNAHGTKTVWTSREGQANDVADFEYADLAEIKIPDIISITAPCQDVCGANANKKGFIAERNDNGLTHLKCAQILNYFRKKNENLMVLTENVLMDTTTLKPSYESMYGMRCFCVKTPGITTRDRYFMSTIEPSPETLHIRTLQDLLYKMHGKEKTRVPRERLFLRTIMASKDNGYGLTQKYIREGGVTRKITWREAYATMGLEDLYSEGPFFKASVERKEPRELDRDDSDEASRHPNWEDWRHFLGNSVDVRVLMCLYGGLKELNFEMEDAHREVPLVCQIENETNTKTTPETTAETTNALAPAPVAGS